MTAREPYPGCTVNRRLANPAGTELFRFEHDGEPIEALPTDTVASALLAAGHDALSRSIKYHRARGPFCLSGRCSHCLVRVDGVPDQLACMLPARPGMSVSTQNAYPSAKHDLLSTIDWVFPRGMNHHSMFAGVPVAEQVMAKVARQIAGLGPLPGSVHAPPAPGARDDCERRKVDVAIVGAGPAGLSCAAELSGCGHSVLVLDEHPEVGGRLLSELDGEGEAERAWASERRAQCEHSGIAFLLGTTVLGSYIEEGCHTLACRASEPDRLLLVEARRAIFCTGTSERLELFGNNELPGIFSGRGLARMVKRQRVLPGKRAVIAASADPQGVSEALALARMLVAEGGEVVALVTEGECTEHPDSFKVLERHTLVAAQGLGALRAIQVADAAGTTISLSCEFLALCGSRAPCFELPRQAGMEVSLDERGYAVRPTEQSGEAELFAAGDVTGTVTLAEAKRSGAELGRALRARAIGAKGVGRE